MFFSFSFPLLFKCRTGRPQHNLETHFFPPNFGPWEMLSRRSFPADLALALKLTPPLVRSPYRTPPWCRANVGLIGNLVAGPPRFFPHSHTNRCRCSSVPVVFSVPPPGHNGDLFPSYNFPCSLGCFVKSPPVFCFWIWFRFFA